MVGMRDVAKKAGVSLSTVSLVINNGEHVSDDVRSRVEWAMDALNYVPNELARNLSKNRTNMVGVIMPTLRHPFFATLFASLQTALEERGMLALPCSTSDMKRGEEEYIDMLRRRMMDGIIMGAHTSHSSDYWTSIGRPIVAFDRYLGPGIPMIGSDHGLGAKLAADIIIQSGAKHVVNLSGPLSQFHDLPRAVVDFGGLTGLNTSFPSLEYYAEIDELLREAGIRWNYMEAGEVDDFAAHERAAHEVFEQFPDVDAIVSSDIVSSLCMQEALRRNINIPHDLQIIAYDGTFVAKIAGMRMTAIRQDFDAIASTLSRYLLDEIQGKPTSELEDSYAQVLPMTVQLGDTTR